MSFQYPIMIIVAAVGSVALVWGYNRLQRQRTAALRKAGLTTTGRAGWRRNLPPLLFLAAIVLLLVGLGRPQATVEIPRATGTVILAFDVSNSMTATDVSPSRLGAAEDAAVGFVQKQPDSVEIGVVAFDQGALTGHLPTSDHTETINAIHRLHPAGGTSVGQAILASLSTITGHPVALPEGDAAAPDLGYWGSATIVVLSDGENTEGPDPVAAAGLAANAGVHIDTIGFGTVEGTTIDVGGYKVSTALDENLLTQIAQTTAGTYHRAGDAQSLDDIYRSLDLRITTKPEFMELTGVASGAAIVLFMIGGMLMISWYGRIL
jgi:Ca-activated chloride channel family protein